MSSDNSLFNHLHTPLLTLLLSAGGFELFYEQLTAEASEEIS